MQVFPPDFTGFKSSHTLSPSCTQSWLNIFVFSQNLQWARDVLLGSSVPWQQLKHMPAQGLFCERNKTNLFNVSLTHTCTCMSKFTISWQIQFTATAWSSVEIRMTFGLWASLLFVHVCVCVCVWLCRHVFLWFLCSKIPSHTNTHTRKSREIMTPHWKCPKLAGFTVLTAHHEADRWHHYGVCSYVVAVLPGGLLAHWYSPLRAKAVILEYMCLPLAVDAVAVRKQPVALSVLAHGSIKHSGGSSCWASELCPLGYSSLMPTCPQLMGKSSHTQAASGPGSWILLKSFCTVLWWPTGRFYGYF